MFIILELGSSPILEEGYGPRERKTQIFTLKDPPCMVVGSIDYIPKKLCPFLSQRTMSCKIGEDPDPVILLLSFPLLSFRWMGDYQKKN